MRLGMLAVLAVALLSSGSAHGLATVGTVTVSPGPDAIQNAYQSGATLILLRAGDFGDQTVSCRTDPTASTVQPAPGATVSVGFLHLGAYGRVCAPSNLTLNGLHRMTLQAFEVGWDGAHRATSDRLLNTQVTSMTWRQNALVSLQSVDHFSIQGSDIGPSAPNSDGVDITTGNTGQPVPSDVTITTSTIHDLYDSCSEVPAYLAGCMGTGFGDGGTCSGGVCNHVDGVQAYGCQVCAITRSVIYVHGHDKQGVFFDTEVHGNTCRDLTVDNDFISTDDSAFALTFKNTPTNLCSGYLHVDGNILAGRWSLVPFDSGSATNTEWTLGSTFRVVGNVITGEGTTVCPGGSFAYSDGSTIPPANIVWQRNLLGTLTPCPGQGDLIGMPTLR